MLDAHLLAVERAVEAGDVAGSVDPARGGAQEAIDQHSTLATASDVDRRPLQQLEARLRADTDHHEIALDRLAAIGHHPLGAPGALDALDGVAVQDSHAAAL